MKQKPWLLPLLITLGGVFGLGNGVWSHVTEPALIWIRNVALNAVTLGIESQKDEVYGHAAMGFHEHVSTTVLFGTILLVSVMIGAMTGMSLSTLDRVRAKALGERSIIMNKMFGDLKTDPQRYYRRSKVFILVVAVFMVYAMGVLTARTIKGQYCTAAISYYNQLRAITAPHISQQRLLEYDAKFATVQTRNDYVALMRELDAEARRHTTKLPVFYVW